MNAGKNRRPTGQSKAHKSAIHYLPETESSRMACGLEISDAHRYSRDRADANCKNCQRAYAVDPPGTGREANGEPAANEVAIRFEVAEAKIMADTRTIEKYAQYNWQDDMRRGRDNLFHYALTAIAGGVARPAEIARLALRSDRINFGP